MSQTTAQPVYLRKKMTRHMGRSMRQQGRATPNQKKISHTKTLMGNWRLHLMKKYEKKRKKKGGGGGAKNAKRKDVEVSHIFDD